MKSNGYVAKKMIVYFYVQITYKGYNGIILIVLYNYKTIYVSVQFIHFSCAKRSKKNFIFF